MFTIGSLFTGVGLFDLGLLWSGLGPVKWQVEIDPWCRAVLKRHYPGVPQWPDVREVGKGKLSRVDLICGGFP